MFFEPKPEGSTLLGSKANCRRYFPTQTIDNQWHEPNYTPPLVEVLVATSPTKDQMMAFVELDRTERGVLINALNEKLSDLSDQHAEMGRGYENLGWLLESQHYKRNLRDTKRIEALINKLEETPDVL